MRKLFVTFLFMVITFLAVNAHAYRTPFFSNNQWRYGFESSEFQSSNTLGYTSNSHLYGARVGYTWENDGWSFLLDGAVGNLAGDEQINDSGVIRNISVQDILWGLNAAPRFHLAVGKSARIYLGMGGALELHFSKLPITITYNKLLPKDLQFGFGPIYFLGFDFLVGESSRLFFEVYYRNVEVPLFNMNNYKVIGPQAVVGFTW